VKRKRLSHTHETHSRRCSLVDLKILEQLKDTTFPEGIKPTKLYSKNVSVDAINMSELLELGNDSREYVTDIKGDFAKRWVSTNRIPEKVRVCVGAQVLCTRNFPELGLANGSRGVITAMDHHGVSFKKVSGHVVRVGLFEVPFDSKLNAVSYLPIKLAWAITIHSAQGMTIDALEVDLGSDIFAFGQVNYGVPRAEGGRPISTSFPISSQAYTGLSRATSLSSVRVVNVLPTSFVTSPKVIEFYA
jgi:hypothetical protein